MQALTPAQQRANRLHLADMIEHRVTDEQFDMTRYANECGTVGCACGIAALSGEIDGLGWNRNGDGKLLPVVDNRLTDWNAIGIAFFGRRAFTDVFIGMAGAQGPTARKQVADALRAIED